MDGLRRTWIAALAPTACPSVRVRSLATRDGWLLWLLGSGAGHGVAGEHGRCAAARSVVGSQVSNLRKWGHLADLSKAALSLAWVWADGPARTGLSVWHRGLPAFLLPGGPLIWDKPKLGGGGPGSRRSSWMRHGVALTAIFAGSSFDGCRLACTSFLGACRTLGLDGAG